MENGIAQPIIEPPQDIFLHFIIALLVLTITFIITSALIESVFCYIFLGDFVKRFRRFFLSFLFANLAAAIVFCAFQFLLSTLFMLITSSNEFFYLLLTNSPLIIIACIKFFVLRNELTRLTRQKVLSKPISNTTLITLFILGTILSLTINYFIIFPTLNLVL